MKVGSRRLRDSGCTLLWKKSSEYTPGATLDVKYPCPPMSAAPSAHTGRTHAQQTHAAHSTHYRHTTGRVRSRLRVCEGAGGMELRNDCVARCEGTQAGRQAGWLARVLTVVVQKLPGVEVSGLGV